MSSKIRAELESATNTKQKEGEALVDFLKRLAKGVQNLSDKEFDELSAAGQDWFNAACDAADAKKPIPEFADEEPEAEAPTRRRRSSGDDEPKSKSYEPKKGDRVNITTKRGKELLDVEFIEIEDDKLIVYKDDEGEADTPLEGAVITSAAKEVVEETTSRRRRSSGDDEPETPADPEVGDTVEVTNKRGKVYVGILKEDNDDAIVVETLGGEVEDIDKSRIEKVVVKHRATKAGGKGDDAKKGDDKPARRTPPAGDEKGKKISNKDNGGVSVSKRTKELVIENQKASSEEVGAMLKKEGLAFRDVTMELNYKDAHAFLDMLRERKMLK